MRPGRLTPENPSGRWAKSGRRTCFNEAGAINPGKPRISLYHFFNILFASMRPGRLTPENRWERECRGSRTLCFNEAGAINPGKPS